MIANKKEFYNIKVLELFAGIGACSKALKRAGISIEIVDAVEIDKYALKSFNAIHNTNFEVQDITTYNKNYTNIDLITHGSPCQDFSVAGKQAGGDLGSGTRSSLMYETIRIVGQIRPKYVLWENVKNILSNKHRHNFDSYIETMNILGYNSYYKVLNAKDYGIPQNRERVYTVSIRKDIDRESFEFPHKEKLELKLKDMLEDEVDEKYFLSSKQIENFIKNKNGNCNPSGKGINGKIYAGDISPTITTNKGEGAKIDVIGMLNIKGNESIRRVYSKDSISPTLTDMQGGNRQPKVAVSGRYNELSKVEQYLEISDHEIVNSITTGQKDGLIGEFKYIKSKQKSLISLIKKTKFQEGKVLNMDLYNQTTNEELSQCLTEPHHNSQRLFDGYRIRKLTPKECWRLMGFDDEDFEKAKNIPTSNTQLYKQAGNSIVVNVLEKIFLNLFRS